MVVMQYGFGRIFVAAFVGFLLGWIWFLPRLFGDAWVRLHKFTKKEVGQGNNPKTIGLAFIATLVAATALAIVLSAWGAQDIGTAVIVGLIAWIGFVATSLLNFVLWGREPEGAYVITALYLGVQFVVMAAILAA